MIFGLIEVLPDEAIGELAMSVAAAWANALRPVAADSNDICIMRWAVISISPPDVID